MLGEAEVDPLPLVPLSTSTETDEGLVAQNLKLLLVLIIFEPPNSMYLPRSFNLTNGQNIPAVGLGTFQGNEGNTKVKEAVKRALQLGYRHIDGATAYGNEKEIGEAIRESGVPREEIFVTTKL